MSDIGEEVGSIGGGDSYGEFHGNGGNGDSEPSEHSDPQIEGSALSCAARDWNAIPADLGAKFADLTKTLDLSYNLLRTLENLAPFTSLDSLILDNNILGDEIEFPAIPSLRTLSVNNNKIEDLDGFVNKAKAAFPNLRFFSMLKNPACPNHLMGGDEEDYRRYRYRVIYLVPDLKFLDSTQVTVAEVKEAKRVGAYLKVARPETHEVKEKEKKEEKKKKEEEVEYPELPQDLAKHGEHRGTFGVSKYVYYGRHSEGNRFIRNNDL